jgi:hypothetical protein
VHSQVVRQARKAGWRLTVQLLLSDDAAEHRHLQAVLKELKAEG